MRIAKELLTILSSNTMKKCSGMSFQMYYAPEEFQEGGSWRMVERLKLVNFDKPPYSEAYPVLLGLAKDLQDTDLIQRMLPKDNLIRNNISYGSGFIRFIGPVSLDNVRIENNLIADEVLIDRDGNRLLNGDEEITRELEKYGNIILKGNPGLPETHPRNKYKFNPGSPASRFDFIPIPIDKIGLEKDEFRK